MLKQKRVYLNYCIYQYFFLSLHRLNNKTYTIMKKVSKVLISLIPTLSLCILVNNMLSTQTEDGCMHFFNVFAFSFAITIVLISLVLRIEKLEQKVKDIEIQLEKKEQTKQ